MVGLFAARQFWTLLSADFAALTAIFAKIGIGNINSDFATFIRTVVVLVAVFGVLFLGEHLAAPNRVGIVLIAAGAILVAYKV